jgi:diguanylate cyclase (GGDEF)-like protein
LRRDPSERSPYCLLLLDIDHFKRVNDRHGHLAGDDALRAVAMAVTATVRKDDIAVRYGGEEIVVYLARATLADASEIARRIRERVAQAPLPFALTVSIGIAAGDPVRDQPIEVFQRADQALYRAKATGRDRVVVDDTPHL